MPNQGFLDFVVNLVKLGGLGLGALIFVLVFIILFRNQPADRETAKLRVRFLAWGSSFAIVALAATTVTSLFQNRSGPASTYRLGVTLSPSFEDAQLPSPDLILMPAGKRIKPDEAVDMVGDATLAIQVRGIVQNVNALKNSSTEMLKTNETLTAALQKSATDASAPVVSGGPPVPVKAAPISVTELRNIAQAQSVIKSSLARGDFRSAAANSAKMRILTSSAVSSQ
jgi:hypothetical protein